MSTTFFTLFCSLHIVILLWKSCDCSIHNAHRKVKKDGPSNSPNFVFILTDDQDSTMDGLYPMTKAKELLGKHGMTFTNSFVASPLCCPSRSSILTGRYVHNHGAVNNSLDGGCASTSWQKTAEQKAFPVYLKQLGYHTFFAGKYLNQYGHRKNGGVGHIPPGWDDWHGLVGNSRYYNYTLSVNGQPEVHGDDYSKDYLTDLIGRRAINFLNSDAANSPFFMMLSTPACHAPFTPSPQYATRFSKFGAPRSPSFDVHGKDKHWLVRNAKHPMSNSTVTYIDTVFRNRWRTLLSVDDIVEKVVSLLTEKNLLGDTYIILTSDNGYHLGQFSLPMDKRQMYEFDVRVPFIIRGPFIAEGQKREEAVSNIDLAPTFIDLAGGVPPPNMDGRSLRPLLFSHSELNHNHSWRDGLFFEHQGEYKTVIPGCPQYTGMKVGNCFPDCVCEDAANNTYYCYRLLDSKTDLVYCWFSDKQNFTELYDMHSDPHQLVNLASVLSPAAHYRLQEQLNKLRSCAGPTCHDTTHISQHFKRHLHNLYKKTQVKG